MGAGGRTSHAQAEFRPYRLFGRGEEQGSPTEIVEMGDLPRRQIKPDTPVDVLLSHYGGSRPRRKSGAQAAAGQDLRLTDLRPLRCYSLFIAQ